MTTHLQLDVIGGISGDMFIGAMLDCFPQLADQLPEQITLAGFPDLVRLGHQQHTNGVLKGIQFTVTPATDASGHHHRHYSDIVKLIEQSSLNTNTKSIALGIFEIIAIAEAEIHDKSISEVAFHEVGAWDSIADIICAAYLIDASGVTSVSCSPIPPGRGKVQTQHGLLPIPAPATALILQGFEFVDDGIGGERVTPTGAAILKYLVDQFGVEQTRFGKLQSQGFGFGQKEFPGIANVLRVLVYNTEKEQVTTRDEQQQQDWIEDQVGVLAFEIDDQTPEQLATALEKLRNTEGVIDVTQYPMFGKKNRVMQSIQILTLPDAIDAITREIFRLTTTLGIRHRTENRKVLRREESLIERGSHQYRIKIANRPGGPTRKVDMDDLAMHDSFKAQQEIRKALEEDTDHED